MTGSTSYDPIFGCEVAHGKRDKDGYVLWGGRRAHIVMWERENGSVPEGMELDHGCRQRACVALHHLEPVTRSENELRKRYAYRVRRVMCKNGHLLAENRIVTPSGGIVCRECNRRARELPR